MFIQGIPLCIDRSISVGSILLGVEYVARVILSTYRRGTRKPKDIAKALSMDKKSVENETNILRQNGYLTKGNKLTTKGLNTLS